MRKRTIKSDKYWYDQIENWKQSGLSQSKYCNLNNIPLSSFATRKSKHDRKKKNSNSLVELKMPAIDFGSSGKIELRLPGNIQLLIQEDIDPLRLRGIVSVFGDAKC